MFDKKQFDIEMENARQSQIEDLADYLSGYINSTRKQNKNTLFPMLVTLSGIEMLFRAVQSEKA